MISDLGKISHPNPQPPSEIRKTVFTQMIQYLITVLNLPNIYTWFPSWRRLSLGYHSTGPSLQLEDDAPFNMTRKSQKIRCIYEENTRKTSTCYICSNSYLCHKVGTILTLIMYTNTLCLNDSHFTYLELLSRITYTICMQYFTLAYSNSHFPHSTY